MTCNEKPYQESIAASVAVSETENSSDKIRKFQSTKKREIYSCEKQSYKLNQVKKYLLVAIQNEIHALYANCFQVVSRDNMEYTTRLTE